MPSSGKYLEKSEEQRTKREIEELLCMLARVFDQPANQLEITVQMSDILILLQMIMIQMGAQRLGADGEPCMFRWAYWM